MIVRPAEPIWARDTRGFETSEAIEQFDARALIGLAEAEATRLASSYGCVVGFIQPDTARGPRRLGFNSHRITVLVEDDRVTRILRVG